MFLGITGYRSALLVLAALALALGAFALARGRAAGMGETFGTGTLTIVGTSGTHRFKVEIARTEAQKEQGLMFRTRLAPDAGMLFVNAPPQPMAMWMKNTLIPLDMLFVGPDGKITNVASRAVPQSLRPIYSSGPALAVIELNGGAADRLGIVPGDRVESAALGAGD